MLRPTLRERFLETFGFSRLVATNIRVKAVSELIVKAGRVLLVIVAARVLGPEGFGLYAFAFAFGSILANASDFGLQMFLSREVARAESPRAAVLGQAIRAKLGLTGCVLLLLAAAFFFYPRPIEDRAFVVLLTLVALLHSWNELWNYFFRGIQSLREEAWLNILNMVVGTGLGILLLVGGKGITGLGIGLLAAEALTCMVALGLLRRHAGFAERAIEAPAGKAIREAAPIGIAILLSILYFRINVLFLERMKGDEVVGAYSAAYKILESFMFLPAVFLAALFPAFAEATRRNLDQMRRVYRNSLRWMLLLATGIVAGSLLLAQPGLRLLYGSAYAGAVPVLRTLSPAILFIFLNYALTHFLVALGGQKWNAIFAGACVLVNVCLNLALIPSLGGIGAAIATVATEGILFALCFATVRKRLARHEEGWSAAAGGMA
ncbi:MAG: flippase [Candidatus Eisenbacteria bacterium]|nr:flippase [Candidatus Eisenbacteria bacterium]